MSRKTPNENQPQTDKDIETLWHDCRHNLCRYLLSIGRSTEVKTMVGLKNIGHDNLVMAFGSPLAVIGNTAPRITDLAELLGISKQLCLQALRPIENADYIFREADPDDARAKRVKLTAKGRAMVVDGLKELDGISLEMAKATGKRPLAQASKQLGILMQMFNIPIALHAGTANDFRQQEAAFPSFSVQISQQLEKRLIQYATALGHPQLKIAYRRVLTAIGLNGTKVQTIAELNGISTQSAMRVIRELESIGYLYSDADPYDQRSKLIYFSAEGLELLRDLTQASQQIETEIKQFLSEHSRGDFHILQHVCKALFEQLEEGQSEHLKFTVAPSSPSVTLNNTALLPSEITSHELLLHLAIQIDQLNKEAQLTNISSRKNTKMAVTFSEVGLRRLQNTVIQPEVFAQNLENKVHKSTVKALMRNLEKVLEQLN